MTRVLSLLVLLLWSAAALSAQKRPLEEVDTDAFTADTQVSAQGAGDDHVAFVWWIPKEFWHSILMRDASMSPVDRQAMLDALDDVSLLVVVQADITRLGAFQFYSKEEIEKNLKITYSSPASIPLEVSPIDQIKADLELVLNVFKPVLSSAMGNLGTNMHFYVLNDNTGRKRVLDPYEEGMISVGLSNRLQETMSAKIETPVNALFVPRKCPNGKDAHVSWKYCPWGGEKLKD